MKRIVILLVLLHTLLSAKSDLDYEPDMLISTLMASFKNQDRILLEKEWIAGQNEYADITSNGPERNPKENEYYLQRYQQTRTSILNSWDEVNQYIKDKKIDFNNAELLYYGKNQDRKKASFSPVFRINKQNYRIRLSECLLIDGQWKLAGAMRIEKVVWPKPSFTKAKTTWGDQLNPTGAIPSHGFTFFYFDIKSKKLLETGHSDTLHVDMSQDRAFVQRHSMEEKNFAAYLVGNIEFAKEEKKNIAIRHTHWSKVRVIVDGNVICNDRCSQDIEYIFTPGKHTVEVEYMSHLNPIMWASVSVKLVDQQEQLSKREARQALAKIITPETRLWYVPLYQAKDGNKPVRLNLKNSKDPVVLFVSSYEAMDLIIKNVDGSKLQSIVFSGDDATTIRFDRDSDIPVIRLLNYPGHRLLFGTEMLPKCMEGPVSLCDGGIEPVLDQIETFSGGHRLNGLSLDHDTNTISVPTLSLSQKDHTDIRQKTQKIYDRHKLLQAPKQYNDLFAQTDKKIQLPSNKFKVTYYDRKANRMVLSKTVENIALRAAWEIEGIRSEDLLAKWEGSVTIPEGQERLFEIANGWSEVKIFVDGTIIYDQTQKPVNGLKTVTHFFSAGKHRIEVRFINGWHTADLYVNLKKPSMQYRLHEAAKMLKPVLNKETNYYYAGIGASDDVNVQTTISFREATGPIVLFMSVKKPTHIKIDNRQTHELKAVVYYAKESASVELMGTSDVQVIPLKEAVDYVEDLPRCAYSKRFESEYCRDVYSITRLNNQLDKMFGIHIDGFGSAEAISHMRMPVIAMDEKQYREIARIQEKEKKLLQARREKSAKELDKINRGRFETTFEK